MNFLSSRPQLLRDHPPPIILKNYTCRYLPYDTPVFSIVATKESLLQNTKSLISSDLRKMHYKDVVFYSAPMVRKSPTRTHKDISPKEVQNVFLTFVCPFYAAHVKNQLINQHPTISMQVVSDNLQDLSYQVPLLKMPLVTIITSLCHIDEKGKKDDDEEVYDIFFTQRYLEKPPYTNDN